MIFLGTGVRAHQPIVSKVFVEYGSGVSLFPVIRDNFSNTMENILATTSASLQNPGFLFRAFNLLFHSGRICKHILESVSSSWAISCLLLCHYTQP